MDRGWLQERRFPAEEAKRATSIRVSRAALDDRRDVREISDPAILQRVLNIVDRYDTWETIPECRTTTCNDMTIEWLFEAEPLLSLGICENHQRASLGMSGALSSCGRRLLANDSTALLTELGKK